MMTKLRTILLAGLVVTVPAIVTVLALRFLFRSLDSFLGPSIARLLGHDVPGLGVLATLLVVLMAGVIARNYAGRRVIEWTERLVTGLPLVRRIYGASKEIVRSATFSDRAAFREVVMIEFPRARTWSYGFLTSTTVRVGEDGELLRLANVFIPGPPVPTTGVLVAVPEEEVFTLDLSVDEVLKLILSAGMAAPAELRRKPDPARSPDSG